MDFVHLNIDNCIKCFTLSVRSCELNVSAKKLYEFLQTVPHSATMTWLRNPCIEDRQIHKARQLYLCSTFHTQGTQSASHINIVIQ